MNPHGKLRKTPTKKDIWRRFPVNIEFRGNLLGDSNFMGIFRISSFFLAPVDPSNGWGFP